MKNPRSIPIPQGYDELGAVYRLAIFHAACQKGHDRHGSDKTGRALNFNDQPSVRITQRRGLGYPLGQADKKTEEAEVLLSRGEEGKAIAELLGAMNYIAFAVSDILRSKP